MEASIYCSIQMNLKDLVTLKKRKKPRERKGYILFLFSRARKNQHLSVVHSCSPTCTRRSIFDQIKKNYFSSKLSVSLNYSLNSVRTQLYRSTKYRVSNVGNPAIVVNSEEIILMTRKNLSWRTPTRSFPRKLSVFLFKLRIYFFAYLGKKRKHFKGIQIFQEARKALFLFACLQYLLMFSLH